MVGRPTYDRAEVLQKALDLFWAKGFQGTSMKDLGAALGMHPGSIYAAFGSKEKLFEESLERYAALSAARLEKTLAEFPSPIDGLADHIRGLGNLDPADGPSRACMLVKTVLETPDDDPVVRRSAEILLRNVEAAFADAFRRAKTRGDLPESADPDHLATWLQMQIFGLRAYAQRSDAGPKVRALAEDIALGVENLRNPARIEGRASAAGVGGS